MVDKIQDLNFPNTVVARLIKEALPDGISVGKEARAAIARAASIFVIYLTSSTAAAARKKKHKSLSSDNVFEALEDIEFESFIAPLRESLELFRKSAKEKKASKGNDNKVKNTTTISGANGDVHDEEMENGDLASATEPTDGTEIEE